MSCSGGTSDIDPGPTADLTTSGIDEEFFLAETVLRGRSPAVIRPGCATQEFLASQLERCTAVLRSLAEAEADLSRFRVELGAVARATGVPAIGTGTGRLGGRRATV